MLDRSYGDAEVRLTGALVALESETLPQVENEVLEAGEEATSGKEPDNSKNQNMAVAASGADSDAGSRPETVQLAGENAVSGTGANSPGSPITSEALNSIRNSGEPLPEGLRRTMGNAMGTGFENVRIHRDAQSAAIAGELGAKAFTHGEDIYFNQGQYNPDTAGGRHLIAHELAHVEQQRTVPGLQYRLEVPAERDRYEEEADAAADKAVSSPASVHPLREQHTPSVTKSSSNSIQLAKDETGSNWLLDKVGGLLKNIPGYDILVLIIGRDPVSGREVKRDGIAFVKAIVGLIPGGKLLLENLEKAGIISRAAAWFKEEFQKLNIRFSTIKGLFDQALKSIGWNLIKSFEQIKNIFLAPIKRIMNFLGKAGPKLMEFIFEGALALAGAPVKAIMGILNKGKVTLGKIIKDPVGFLKNLLNAVKGGLSNFAGNIGAHLQNGIGGWIFGALGKAGITLPEKLNLAGIFSIAAQVLGVTWRAIRALVVKRLGDIGEKVMSQVEKGVALVTNLITKGPLALLETAKDFLAELKTLFFDTLINWVRNTIIVKAIQKLISMFNPVGAIIQAVITIYNTIQFFIERAKQIAAFVSAVFNSIAEIAGGNIGKAVAAVENALAKGVPVAISFLANLIGLGGIAKKVREIIKKVRKPIDKVVGKVVGVIVGKAKILIAKIKGSGEKKEELPKNQAEHDTQVKAGLAALEGEQKKVDKDRDSALTFEEAEDVAKNVKRQYPVFKSITVVDGGDTWDYDYVASPGKTIKGSKKPEGEKQGGENKLIVHYKDELDKAPNETKTLITNELNDQSRADALKKLKTWGEVCKNIVQDGKLQPIYQKPLSKAHPFGERVQEEVAIPALRKVETEKQIDDCRKSIYGREPAIHKEEEPYGPKPLKKLRVLIFNWMDNVSETIKVLVDAFIAAKSMNRLSSEEMLVVEELEKLSIQGAKILANRIRTTTPKQGFRAGLVFQAQRAIEYARQGKLKEIEVDKVIKGEKVRFDMIIEDFGKVRANEEKTEIIIETKAWTNFNNWKPGKQESLLIKLLSQLEKYRNSGMPLRLEWKGIMPQVIKDALAEGGFNYIEI